MRKKRYSDEKITFVLMQAEARTFVDAIGRELGIFEPAFYRWKRQFAGMGVAEIRWGKQLEERNPS